MDRAGSAGDVAIRERARRVGPPVVWHFYGRTVAGLGLGEDEFIAANSSPAHGWHECLRRLRAEHGVESRIILLSEARRRRTVEHEDLIWDLVPVTLGALHARRPWRGLLGRPEYQFSLEFERALRRAPPDLFVFYGNLPTPFARYLASLLVRRGVPYVATVHGLVADALGRLAPAGRRGLRRRLARLVRGGEAESLFGNAAAVLVLTGADRALLVDSGLARPERVHVLPSGISARHFHPDPGEPQGPYPTLGFAGRFSDAKGFLDAVRCLVAVRQRFPAARLIAAGSWLTDGYEREVRDFLARHALADAVVFHPYLPPEELARFYRRCHLLLFPTKREGLGRVALEALMCGVPVVAVAGSGGPDELIRDGDNGLLGPREALPGRIAAALEDPAALRAMAARAAAGAARGHSLDAMYARVEALYLRLLA